MITSLANQHVKYVRRLQAHRRFRLQESQYVIEGSRWVSELIDHQVVPTAVFVTAQWAAAPIHAAILQQLKVPAQLVSPAVMQAMSDTETAPGVLALLPIMPPPLPQQRQLLLILDGVQNPGNLGTILRSAAAAGADGVLLAPGCVDAYNPKVVRGSMGAHLRLPILSQSWSQIAELVMGMAVWIAAASAQTAYTAVDWRQPSALIIGSEAHGAGKEAQRLANGRLQIPMQSSMESLNAAIAASVILFEAARQRQQG